MVKYHTPPNFLPSSDTVSTVDDSIELTRKYSSEVSCIRKCCVCNENFDLFKGIYACIFNKGTKYVCSSCLDKIKDKSFLQ